jgi:threonine/homoserine/homoserine lactone efflux protein
VAGIGYALSNAGDPSTSSGANDSISWGKIVLGAVFLVLSMRQWRSRPEPGTVPEMPKWMADVDALEPGKTFGLGILLGAVNPKNLVLSLAAAAGLAQLGLAAGEVVVSIIVFVVLGSLTIAGPVAYYLFGGERAKTVLNDLKDWLGAHNAAVMTVLFLVFGVDLIAKGLPPLTT